MEKGLLKNKIFASLTVGLGILALVNVLLVGSSSYHIFKQNYDKKHLDENDFVTVEEYEEKMEYCDSEIERVTPIRKGFIAASGVSALGAVASYAVLKYGDYRKKKQMIEETDTYIGM